MAADTPRAPRGYRTRWDSVRYAAGVAALAALLVLACGSEDGGPAAAPASPEPAPETTPAAVSGLEPRAVECGEEIVEDTVMANDLTCPGNALVIAADGIRLDLNGHVIDGPGRGPWVWPYRALFSVGVKALGRTDVWVGNGTVKNFATGFLVDATTDSEVNGAEASDNFYGIYLVESTRNRIVANMVHENTYGIHLQMSSDNTVVGNDSYSNLYRSPGGYGINVIESHDNVIRENIIRANVNQGIWLMFSNGNTIFRNDLIGNNPNGLDDSGRNTWYSSEREEGNYWSDYEGEDTDGDGIGDSPYNVHSSLSMGQIKDQHPSMTPFRWQRGQ